MPALFTPFELGPVCLSNRIVVSPMVALARAFLADPRWGWRAADTLGADIDYPPQYLRAKGGRRA